MMKQNNSGFTLIEVLIALAIVSISLGALISISSQDISRAERMQKSMIANWVAQNQITEHRLSNKKIKVGSTKGSILFAKYDWEWELSVSRTSVDNLYRMDVYVSELNKNIISRNLTGFVFEDIAINNE
ncbi:MAG: type II secretion system protein GspI [Woeseiaceae bacterium]|nr:type II secretion system protein GspI [Woeseiaceae bacterium]